MNRFSVFSAFFIVFLIFGSSVYAGGGWTQKKGEGYFQVSEFWIIANKHYTDQGEIDPNLTTGLFNTSFYGEYGFNDRFTGIVNFPFFSRTYNNNLRSSTTGEILIPGESINTVGDLDLAIKYGFLKKKFVLSGTLLLGIPTGNSSGGSQMNLQTGDGEFNQLIQFDGSVGYAVKKVSMYSSAYLGFNHRTNGFSEEFRWGFEQGVGFWNQRIWLTVKLNAVESFQNGETAADNLGTSLFANNSEYISYNLGAAFGINDKWGVNFSYGSAFSAKLIFAAPAYTAGVYFKLKKTEKNPAQ